MLSFDEARARILSACGSPESEELALALASGRTLAEDVFAAAPLPPFDASAMDGYAVAASSLTAGPPYELRVANEARAGGPRPVLGPNQAIRIFTGAELPLNADSVVIQEQTTVLDERVRIAVQPQAFDNVRRAGEDLKPGALALSRGTRLGPFQLGLAAALDRPTLQVARRPRLVIVSSGDELREPGSTSGRGSIPNSNRFVLAALAAQGGAEVGEQRHVPDELEAATRVFSEVRDSADVLVTLGGVSVGKHDVIRAALSAAGAELDFWKVAIKPGKPFTFGRLGRTLVLGLPGNPVSAQVTFALLGLPLLRALQGAHSPLPRTERVTLATPLRQTPGRLNVYRGRLSGRLAHLDSNQASGSTVSMAQAEVLVFVPADVTALAAGSELDAIRLSEL